VRQSVFYPSKPGRNFITVKGFILRRAATPWAPPTAEQIGLIGTHWSKGWIIENNVVSHSACAGISLGKYGDEFDNTSQDSAEGYVKTIERAIKRGWSKENIGSHLVRGNRISHCEQAGIVVNGQRDSRYPRARALRRCRDGGYQVSWCGRYGD
jgi:alpha-N-arabinofuranosidase